MQEVQQRVLKGEQLADILCMVVHAKKNRWPECEFVVVLREDSVYQYCHRTEGTGATTDDDFTERVYSPIEFEINQWQYLVDIMTFRTDELVQELDKKTRAGA